MTLEEEAKLGKRHVVTPEALQPGDVVTVDDGQTPPETGTVETADGRLVRVVDEAGSPIAVVRPDAPAETDPVMYTATPESDPELDGALQEIGRLVKRTQDDPQDKGALDALRKIRNGPEFQKLPEESRDLIDDHLRDSDRAVAAAEEAAKEEKAAEKTREKERQAAMDAELTAARERIEQLEAANREEEARLEQEAADRERREQESIARDKERREASERIAAQEDQTVETEAPVEAESEVITPAGRRVKVAPEVVEASSLVTSHDEAGTVNPAYPQEVQPRDRSRTASQVQIAEMAGDITPELLMPSPQASEGAPIIGPDDVVESGNARSLALLKAYREGGADAYRKALEDAGYDVAGMDAPVLVQRRTQEMTPEERAEFAREANARTTADRGAAEVAASDAAGLGTDILAAYRGGQITEAGNRDFVRRFIEGVVPTSERAAMTTAGGELSQQGVQRIENAMFMSAYEDAEILGQLREETDTNIRAIGYAMIEAAPEWAAMRDASEEGSIDPEADVTPHLLDAVNTVRKSRNEGTPIAMLVGQQEMFSGEAMHPLAESMLATMYRDPGDWKKPLGRERMAAALKKIAEEAQKTTPGPDMFGEYTDVEGLLATGRRAAMEGLKGEEETQIDAFGGPGAPIPGQTEQPAGEGGAQPPDGEAEAGGREGDAPEGAGDAGTGVEVKEHAPDGAIDRLSGQIADQIMRGRKLDNPALFRMADEAFGGTVGDGVYDPQDAYHAVELAMNRRIDETDLTNMTPKEVARFAKELTDATELLPTQTRRTAEKQEFQQFSTPPAYAVAANWAAGIREGDQVLEPSAGVGGLAVVARSMGADVTVNEISEKRAENLRILGFDPTMEDAEQIANIMEPESFDVVVMNPPFSAAGKRGVATSNRIGARHVSQAVKMLKPGGRLVAIMGEGFTPENSTVTPAFREMNAEGQIQAIVKVDGRIYRKYGTTFDNQLIVFDKTGEPGNPEAIQRAEYDNIPDLITALEPIHDSRPVAEDGDRGAIRPAGEPGTGLPGDVVVPGEVAQPGTGAGAARPGSRDRPADGRPVIAPVREGADEATLGGGGQGAGPDAGTVAEPGPSDRPGRDEQRGGQGVEQVAVEAERIQEEEGTAFSAYKPARVKVKGAKQHPAKLVESTAMASVKPPKPAYTPQIDEPTITEGRLSDAQLEQITYAGNAHAKMLPNGRRRGYFIGDGTGVGKGREVSGIILDNWNQGRKKAVWVSKDKKLLTDARRDIAGVGFEGPLLDLTSTAKARKVEGPEGVAFTTYSTLRSAGTKEEKQANVKFPNVQKLAAWLGEDFDGVVAFDEAHVMANLMGSAGARGGRGPSQVAQAGEYLQELLPNARVVYVSATGATEVSNLGYLDRLGLWGEGTAFSGVQDFTAKIGAGGVATMELVARDMKQMGLYGARSISYEGVEYDNVTHDLTEDQALMYDTAARAWQVVFNNINEVMDILMPGASASQQSRAKPMSYFWGANQRFFNQVLTSMQMPSVIESIETDLKEGRAPVLQLTNTNEAATTRAVAALEEGQTLDDIDITPRQVIIDFVDAAFPTTQMQEVEDEFGNIRWEPVVAADGVTVVQNAEAVAMKNQLLAELASLRLPGNPLDMILEHFGTEKVAEITGRSNRVVTGSEGRKEKQPRSHTARLAEIEDFQEGRRDVLVFSAAGGTGASYHADLDATNQKRRSHYVLQAGWKADEAIQGFGRTHRSNEANQPQYRLVQTNLPAHKRFVATIARRLDQLGALTKGQREASATGLFTATDNLENEYAQQAVYQLFNEIKDGEGVMSMTEAYEKMGIAIPTDQPLKIDDIPVHRFLNRLLSLEIEDQNKVFEDFADKLGTNIEAAVEAGEYEVGVETYKAEGAEIQDRQTIHTDEETGAKTEYIQVEVERRNIPVTFGMIQGRQGGFVVNRQSGKVYFMEPAQPRTDPRTGAVTDRVRRHGVNVQQLMPATEFSADKYETIDDVTRAEELWNQAVAELPATRKSTVHMLAGALLPVYDRIESQSKKVQRIILNDGTSLLGRVMSGADAQKTLKNFGKGTQLKAVPASELVSIIRERNASAQLSNGVQIKEATVSGEARLELLGLAYSDALPSGPLARMGFQSEMMNYRQRMFVPNGPDGVAVLDRYLKGKEVVEIVDRHGNDIAGDVKYAMAGRDPKALQKAYGPALRDELEEIAARLAPSVRFETMNKRKLTTAGAVGMYIPGETIGSREVEPLIVVAMQGAPREILRHEAIHALKEQGLFTPAEWSALEHAAETGKWLDKHGIRDRYPGLFREDGSATPAAVEEAIADEFAGWTEGKADAARSVTVRRLFDRIFEFFRDLTARLRGYGVTPRPGSIFDAVERGEVGARPVPARPAGAQAETKFKVEFANPETEKRWQEASKGVKPTAFGRIGEAIREEWRKLTRTYQHLPQTRTFADALEKMNHLAQSEHAAKERIASLFDDVMGGLEAQDVDLLTRKMVLDDLLWSSSEGMDLPFGLKGTGDVLDALHDVETALDARPELMARLERRNQARDELKNAMVGAGVLNQRQARNPHYFRHQVLEYASVRAKGAGKRKVVSTYWHSRRGSEKDINANYFQAEADWMYKAHQDLATARFLNWLRGSQYNQKRELVRRAKADNLDTLNEKIAGELKEGGKSAIADQWGKTGRNIGIAMSKLRADLRKRDEGELRTIIPDALHGQLEAFLAGGGERAATDDGGNSPVFGLIQHLADSSIEGANEKAGIVLATVYNRRKFLRDTLGDAYVNPQDVRGLVKRYLGETHDAWQPDSFDGKTRRVHIFTGKTVAQHVLDRAVDNLSGIVGDVLTEEQVDQVRELLANGRDVRMMGGPMEELVLPQEITATLNEFYDEGVTGAVDALAVMVTGRWKQWVLFNPARFAKYYLNNVTGDMDALLATKAGKGVAKQIPQAFRDVKRMIYNNEISDTLAEALEKGVVQSSLVMQEVTGMGPLADDSFRPQKIKGVLKYPSKYFNQVQNFARLRENAFRYAAYLHYRGEFDAGKSLADIGYGASPPWMVEGITGRHDKAARMARDLLGDYGAIPVRARWARKRGYPVRLLAGLEHDPLHQSVPERLPHRPRRLQDEGRRDGRGRERRADDEDVLALRGGAAVEQSALRRRGGIARDRGTSADARHSRPLGRGSCDAPVPGRAVRLPRLARLRGCRRRHQRDSGGPRERRRCGARDRQGAGQQDRPGRDASLQAPDGIAARPAVLSGRLQAPVDPRPDQALGPDLLARLPDCPDQEDDGRVRADQVAAQDGGERDRLLAGSRADRLRQHPRPGLRLHQPRDRFEHRRPIRRAKPGALQLSGGEAARRHAVAAPRARGVEEIPGLRQVTPREHEAGAAARDVPEQEAAAEVPPDPVSERA